MNIKIKLSLKKSYLRADGYPVIFYFTSSSEYKKEKILFSGFRSKIKNWDAENALPKKNHPLYFELLDYLEIKKIKIAKIVNQSKSKNVTYLEAEKFIFNNKSGIFYDEIISKYESGEFPRIYKTAAKSFNIFFLKYRYDLITEDVVNDYINKIAAKKVNGKPRSINGVLTYLNTLSSAWSKLNKKENPFKKVKRPAKKQTNSKTFTNFDLLKISKNPYIRHYHSKGGGRYDFFNYLMLCFYLGGCDMEVLWRLRYDENLINGRIVFNRRKGGSNVLVSNKLLPQAKDILKNYDCYPYFVPLFKINYSAFHSNMSRIYESIKKENNLSVKPYSKGPRYTFINRAKELLIDERITMEIVGHSEGSVHSIYKDNFSYKLRDKAHKKIIDFKNHPL